MSEISLSQSLITISIAIAIYVLKSLMDEFLFEPKKEYNKIRAQIATALIFYSNKYSNPFTCDNLVSPIPKNLADARKELRKLASDLYGFSENICDGIRRKMSSIPSKSDLNTTVKNLIGLSNSLTKIPEEKKTGQFNRDRVSKIQKFLKIHPID